MYHHKNDVVQSTLLAVLGAAAGLLSFGALEALREGLEALVEERLGDEEEGFDDELELEGFEDDELLLDEEGLSLEEEVVRGTLDADEDEDESVLRDDDDDDEAEGFLIAAAAFFASACCFSAFA